MTESPDAHIGFLEAAISVLAEADEPLHYREITRLALDRHLISTEGQTPWATMNARIASTLKRQGDASEFVRVSPGVFGLRTWVEEGRVEAAPTPTSERTLVPHYPIYDHTRAVMSAWVGAPPGAITGMRGSIRGLEGTPQSQVDWSNPDEWIEERLEGEAREWARCTWERSGKLVNPRHITGHWLLASNAGLLQEEPGKGLAVTDRGDDFIDNPDGRVVQEIDRSQGLATLLELVADVGPAARAELLGPWVEYLQTESRIRSESAAKSTLWARLRNLAQRGLLEKQGRTYSVTPAGLAYLDRVGGGSGPEPPDEEQQLRRLLHEKKKRVREAIRDLLADMDPHAFEHLVKQLLEAMEYDDVEVTAASNDKGVDVVANIELGITSVREVVQVKRHQANIGRPVLDQLRGSLHRFGAVRGTIITTGGFSRGTTEAAFEPGAAPITLISGDKLIDLMMENGIGVKKRSLESWELDEDLFSGSDDEAEDEQP
jgi:restriction system protein